MDADEEKAVRNLFEKHEDIVVAYLFGSTARGDAHAGSDVDVAVLFDTSSIGAYKALWSELHDILGRVPFDLVTLNHADPVLCFDVIREGRPLYYRSADELNSFERRAWHRYQDTRRLRAVGDMYLKERAEAWSSRTKRSASASSDSKR